ncbi:SGNH/GDSL hydrolase family protein [Streptomyces halstedii]|uniref:SGNH/GDSL hydrolase family protein n=1 Tax=Streptomyces halstedii TaxID=1944 RepID=UPI00382BA8C7
MPKRTLRHVMTATIAAVGALALSAGGAVAQTAAPLDYVALGDSYGAGSGVLPIDLSSPLCLRSTVNYPHVLASATGARLTDVTCGAAETKHLAQSQYPGVAPQSDALNADTDLVTVTIGGNDNSTFVSALTACASAGVLSGGKGSPCKDNKGTHFDDQIEANTYPALVEALRNVHAKAPGARVAALGYPWIMPATADPSCFLKLPVASGDVPYLRGIQAHLNAVIARAAAETGTTYVDFTQVSEGHDACKASGTRWIEPLVFGTNIVPVHPNALGERRMAEHAMDVLGLG